MLRLGLTYGATRDASHGNAPDMSSGVASPGPMRRGVDALLVALERLIGRVLPTEFNPLFYTGALASLSIVIAVISGVALLLWYVPSVHQAHDSVRAMEQQPLFGGLVRSVHRYSSDAAVLFAFLHALKMFVTGRFIGARWLAWATGIIALGVLWFIGWLGYWLVWDDAGQEVAVATARFAEVLPVFAEPVSAALLVDDQVNSLLFFVIFFLHMVVPLGLAVILWLHVARLARAVWVPPRGLSGGLVAALVLLALLAPAVAGEPARLQHRVAEVSIDLWYLWPLYLFRSLSPGQIWLVAFVGYGLLLSMPLIMRPRPRPSPALVIEDRCNACRQCILDCPYGAITLVPRSDGKDLEGTALVDPDRCTSCGICAGSCNSFAIGMGKFQIRELRRKVLAMVDGMVDGAGEVPPVIGFCCAESGGATLRIHPESGVVEGMPPQVRMVTVPCAGAVHVNLAERALRHGAAGVFILSCAPGNCRNREGHQWTAERLSGAREPGVNTNWTDTQRIRLLQFATHEAPSVRRAIVSFANECSGSGTLADARKATPQGGHCRRAGLLGLGAAILSLALFVLAGGSSASFATLHSEEPAFVVSFKHAGEAREQCRELSPEELAALPSHMRRSEQCKRQRGAVWLLVEIDGKPVLERSYAARGLWGDGMSAGIEQIDVSPGAHTVRVALGDRAGEWRWDEERALEFRNYHRQVVTFGGAGGFDWSEGAE